MWASLYHCPLHRVWERADCKAFGLTWLLECNWRTILSTSLKSTPKVELLTRVPVKTAAIQNGWQTAALCSHCNRLNLEHTHSLLAHADFHLRGMREGVAAEKGLFWKWDAFVLLPRWKSLEAMCVCMTVFWLISDEAQRKVVASSSSHHPQHWLWKEPPPLFYAHTSTPTPLNPRPVSLSTPHSRAVLERARERGSKGRRGREVCVWAFSQCVVWVGSAVSLLR